MTLPPNSTCTAACWKGVIVMLPPVAGTTLLAPIPRQEERAIERLSTETSFIVYLSLCDIIAVVWNSWNQLCYQ